MNIGIKLNKKK